MDKTIFCNKCKRQVSVKDLTYIGTQEGYKKIAARAMYNCKCSTTLTLEDK